MRKQVKAYGISTTGQDAFLWDVTTSVWDMGYSINEASVICDPLAHLLRTGRLSAQRLHSLLSFTPRDVARVLVSARRLRCTFDETVATIYALLDSRKETK